MLFCKGERFDIDQTPDAEQSWEEVSREAECVGQLIRLAQRLADVGRLRSPDQFNNEGDGFWAIKAKCGLRAYGWFHSTRRKVFVISHFIIKKQPKLSLIDKERMKENRRQFDPTH